jgi:hypothetical protein
MPIYAKAGESLQYIATESQALKMPDLVLMSGPRPSALHVADASGDWVVSEDLARAERDYRLRCYVDCMNPAWWEMLPQADKDAIQAYRQALLDVPQQLDFPHDINWPQKPELLSGDDVLMQPK